MITPVRLAWTSAILLSAALFYAPLAYGCTRPDMLPPLFALLGASIVTGAIPLFFQSRAYPVPSVACVCVVLLLIQGWWVTWDPVFHSVLFANDGMADTTYENIRQLSFASMTATSLLLGSFLMACGLFANARLRRFLLLAAASSGVLICVIGIFLKFDKPAMSYVWQGQTDWNIFAFYRYHGNAGAFLNLVWPVILVFTRRAYSPTIGVLSKIGWTLAALACGAALLVNASKASLIIGLCILPWPFSTWLMALPRKTLLALIAGTICLIAAAMFASSKYTYEGSISRLANGGEVTISVDGRAAAYQQFVNALPGVGFLGVGPGLFQIAFPYQDSPLGNVRVGLREYAHEDYLQTVIEWGWLGSVWWLALGAGGLYRAFWTYSHRELFTSRTDRHLVLAAILGVIGTLVQASIDFPLQIASLRLFFLLLLALCWASPQLLAPPTPAIPFRRSIPKPAITTSSRLP